MKEKRPDIVDVEIETEKWRERLKGNGYRTNQGLVSDVAATWRYWMLNARQGGSAVPQQSLGVRIVPIDRGGSK